MLEACVLVPAPLPYTLLRLAEYPRLYLPRWTEAIIDRPFGIFKATSDCQRKRGHIWLIGCGTIFAAVMKTSLYFGTANFASRIKAPMLAAMGFIDTICPPAGVWTAINQIPGLKE